MRGSVIEFILQLPWSHVLRDKGNIHQIEGSPVPGDHAALLHVLVIHRRPWKRRQNRRLKLIGINRLGEFDRTVHVFLCIIIQSEYYADDHPYPVFFAGCRSGLDIVDILMLIYGIKCGLV